MFHRDAAFSPGMIYLVVLKSDCNQATFHQATFPWCVRECTRERTMRHERHRSRQGAGKLRPYFEYSKPSYRSR